MNYIIIKALDSERLCFKKCTKEDAKNYLRLATNQEVMKMITGKALTVPEAMARFKKVLEINEQIGELGVYTACLKKNDQFIGVAKIVRAANEVVEIGYSLLPEFWGNGYATEISLALVHYAQQFPNIFKIVAMIDPENKASKQILLKSGLTFSHYSKYFGLNAANFSLDLVLKK